MKENVVRFRLAYSLLILENNMYKELGPLCERELIENILYNQEELSTRLEVLEIFKLFYQSQYKSILSYITTN